MIMIRKSTIGIISVLLFSSCVAQEPVPALPFCTAEKDCSVGCTCVPQIQNFCAKAGVLNNSLSGCTPCTLSEGCGSGDLCIANPPSLDTGFCASCALPAAFRAAATCKSFLPVTRPKIPSASPSAQPSTSSSTSASTSASASPSSQPSLTSSVSPSTSSAPSSLPSPFITSTPSPSAITIIETEIIPMPTFELEPEPTLESDPVCVETSWIERNGLSDGISKKYKSTRVLCIASDLPCGTPGHILRVCDAEGCKLKTYDQICASTSNCVETMRPVSRLRHNFDWTIVQTKELTEFGQLHLTSLSQTVGAGAYNPSRLIAQGAYILNYHRLGFICDAIVSINSFIGSILNSSRSLRFCLHSGE